MSAFVKSGGLFPTCFQIFTITAVSITLLMMAKTTKIRLKMYFYPLMPPNLFLCLDNQKTQEHQDEGLPVWNLGQLSGITLALLPLVVGPPRTGHGDAGEAGQSGHGRAAGEGVQAERVPGQDPDCFQTGQVTGGLQVPVQEPQHQLPQDLHHTTDTSGQIQCYEKWYTKWPH